MSNSISEHCKSELHGYCIPCECNCHKNRLEQALWFALVKCYDNYRTPLGSSIRCFKSRYIPKDQMWDDKHFVVWIEASKINTIKERFGTLIPTEYWKEFNIMIEYNIPNGIELKTDKVIERLMLL